MKDWFLFVAFGLSVGGLLVNGLQSNEIGNLEKRIAALEKGQVHGQVQE